MSSLTECNYCTYRAIRNRAEREGKKVELVGATLYVDGEKVAWFMQMTTSCAC